MKTRILFYELPAGFETRKTVGLGVAQFESGRHIQSQNSHPRTETLSAILCDSIGEALTNLLGPRVREAIYDYMERKHSIARNEIPTHLHEFFSALEGNFGLKAKNVIGRTIARNAYRKLDWKFEPVPTFEFADYLEKIKARVADKP